jgi:hypothetical protein
VLQAPDKDDPNRMPTSSDPTVNLGRWMDGPEGRAVFAAIFAALASAIFAPAIGIVFPAIMVPAIEGFVRALFDALLTSQSSEAFASAVLSSAVLQGGRVLSSVATPANLKTIGVELPPELATLGRDELTAKLGQLASQYVTERFFGDLALLSGPNYSALRDGAVAAKGQFLASQGTSNLDTELRKIGLSPEQFAARLTEVNKVAAPFSKFKPVSLEAREDVAAMALNTQLGVYVYDIDWFEPVTGKFITSPGKLRALRDDLAARGGSPQALEVLDNRIERTPLSVILERIPKRARLPPDPDAPAAFGLGLDDGDDVRAWRKWSAAFGSGATVPAYQTYKAWLLTQGRDGASAATADLKLGLRNACRAGVIDCPPALLELGVFPDMRAASGESGIFSQLLRAALYTSPAWAPMLLLPWYHSRRQ